MQGEKLLWTVFCVTGFQRKNIKRRYQNAAINSRNNKFCWNIKENEDGL